MFIPLGYPGVHLFGRLFLNIYTSPAIACMFINILCMILLRTVFDEKYAGLANPNAKNSSEKEVHVPKYDKIAVGICHLTRFVQLFSFAAPETVGTPFIMIAFALNGAKTVQIFSTIYFVGGLVSICFYVFIALYKKEIIDYRKLCIGGGLFGILLFYVLTIPLPFTSGQITTYTSAGKSLKLFVRCLSETC